MPTGNLFPRATANYGSARYPGLVGALSLPTTCGVLCFITSRGNDAYLYINGLNPMTLMFGGVTEVMTSPATGIAIGTAIPAVPLGSVPPYPDGWTIFGSPRVSSSIAIQYDNLKQYPPAVGIMNNGSADIQYLYVTDSGVAMNLRSGSEAEWMSAAAGTVVAGPVTPSGALGPRRDGRSILASDWRGFPTPLVVQSTGKSGCFALANGDYSSAYAIAVDPTTKALHLDTVPGWKAWV